MIGDCCLILCVKKPPLVLFRSQWSDPDDSLSFYKEILSRGEIRYSKSVFIDPEEDEEFKDLYAPSEDEGEDLHRWSEINMTIRNKQEYREKRESVPIIQGLSATVVLSSDDAASADSTLAKTTNGIYLLMLEFSGVPYTVPRNHPSFNASTTFNLITKRRSGELFRPIGTSFIDVQKELGYHQKNTEKNVSLNIIERIVSPKWTGEWMILKMEYMKKSVSMSNDSPVHFLRFQNREKDNFDDERPPRFLPRFAAR